MGQTTFSGPVRVGTVREGASANVGKVVCTQSALVSYTDAGSAVTIGIVPAGSQILDIYVDVLTAFNSSGTDLIDVGTSADDDLYAVDLDVSSAGRKLATSDVSQIGELDDVGTSDVTVTATYAQSVADASAGSARVTIVYVPSADLE